MIITLAAEEELGSSNNVQMTLRSLAPQTPSKRSTWWFEKLFFRPINLILHFHLLKFHGQPQEGAMKHAVKYKHSMAQGRVS